MVMVRKWRMIHRGGTTARLSVTQSAQSCNWYNSSAVRAVYAAVDANMRQSA